LLAVAGAHRLAVLRPNGHGWQEHLVTSTSRGPFVQPAPEAGLLVVDLHSRRSAEGRTEPNGRIYGPAGALVQEFVVGDGVADVQATDEGIWVAYSDLGTTGDYGLYGWGRLSPEVWVDPIGYPGLVRFSWSGQVEAVAAPPPGLPIIDCFALNVQAEEVWASSFPGYPVLRVERDGTTRALDGLALPVTAIAVDPPTLVAVRAVAGQRLRAWRAVVGATRLEHVEEAQLILEGEEPESIRQVIGRGGELHAVTDRAWYRFSRSMRLRDPSAEA
jgi:hypothetical protein